MQLQINDFTTKTWLVDNTDSFENFTYNSQEIVMPQDIKIAFVNDFPNRDLEVDYIKIDDTTYQTEANTTYSTGTYNPSTSCSGDYKQSQVLHCNGYFHYNAGISSSDFNHNYYIEIYDFNWLIKNISMYGFSRLTTLLREFGLGQ